MLKITSRRRELALLVLVFLYGICILLLQNLVPEFAVVLFSIPVALIVLVIAWKAWKVRRQIVAIMSRIVLFPVRVYRSGIEAPSASAPTLISVIISAALCAGVVFVLLLFLVLPVFAVIIGVPLAGMAFFAWRSKLDPLLLPRRFLRQLKTSPALSTSTLPRLKWWLVILEMAAIVFTTLMTTRPFYESPPNFQLSGNESEWLTSTAAAAYNGLQETGRIPRWQPYLSKGEPVIENPFNFIFNPFASGPSLLLGPVIGLRISVILGYFLAGLGGWFLGRVLGLGSVARVLLAMLLIGKGNIHAMLDSGYYQLALSQIYMPYVIGGVIAIFRWSNRRWPVVLTALALALQFLSGNIWYVLPTAVGAVIVGCVLLIGKGNRWIDVPALKRLILTAIFAAGLSAVVAVPVLLQFKQIGRHPDEIDAGWFVSVPNIVQLYFDPNPIQLITMRTPSEGNKETYRLLKELDEFFYSFIIPGWFVVLILFALPLYRPTSGRERRVWWVALLLCILATLWGAGGKQPVLWLYQNIPALAQWRFVGRALGVATFWLALLIAMRVDNLWRNISLADWSLLFGWQPRGSKFVPIILAGLLLVASAIAGAQVNDQWYKLDKIMHAIEPVSDRCVTWLRTQHPHEFLSVWQHEYTSITTFLNNRVRTWLIGADFEMLPQPATVGSPQINLNKIYPEYARVDYYDQIPLAASKGYKVLLDSPRAAETAHCLYRRTESLPYAYTVSKAWYESMKPPEDDDEPDINLKAFTPVDLVERRGDQIALVITAARTERTIVGLQESAYPGWRVEVDGKPAQIESVGGQIGVVLPVSDQPVQVYFVYDPIQPVIGGWITLISAVLCTLYLLVQRPKQSIETKESLTSYSQTRATLE
ncbi:MAG: hypothetical protein GC179_11540 [Anaerolineaceae bacterium]|nr:hypothetical protein [Anaerolineaceae bacterium]